MAGVGEDLFDGCEFDDLAGVHYADAVGELRHESHVVADEDYGGADLGSDVFEGFHDLALDYDIQGTSRFVGEDQARLVGNRHGDGDALLHSTAEFVREQVQDATVQSDLVHQCVQAFV